MEKRKRMYSFYYNVTVYISKNDMDVNEHERLSNITLRHTLM